MLLGSGAAVAANSGALLIAEWESWPSPTFLKEKFKKKTIQNKQTYGSVMLFGANHKDGIYIGSIYREIGILQ